LKIARRNISNHWMACPLVSEGTAWTVLRS
jgi:hypothetical protein